jgi:hypothetical protein
MTNSDERPFDDETLRKFKLRNLSRAFCPVCAKQVDLTSFEIAAELFRTDLQDIQFLVNEGSVHQLHNRKGKLMVCSASLFTCFDSRRTRLNTDGILKTLSADGSA